MQPIAYLDEISALQDVEFLHDRLRSLIASHTSVLRLKESTGPNKTRDHTASTLSSQYVPFHDDLWGGGQRVLQQVSVGNRGVAYCVSLCPNGLDHGCVTADEKETIRGHKTARSMLKGGCVPKS